jgi:hypothetical protein
MQRNVVLLPDPLGPRKVKNWPSPISMLTSLTAPTSPLSTIKVFRRLLIFNILLLLDDSLHGSSLFPDRFDNGSGHANPAAHEQ